MKIAIEKYPFVFSEKIGPYIFLKRLSKSLKIKYDITNILNPFYDIGLFTSTSKSIYNKPYVLRIGGVYFDKNNTIQDTVSSNQKIFNSINNSIGVIFVSEFTKKLVLKLYKEFNKKNIVINNAVPLDVFKPSGNNKREELGINENDFVIVASASWRRHKRLEEIIEFFFRIKKKNKFKLLILGNVQNKIFDNDIIYTGNINPIFLPDWYRTGNLFLNLSWLDHSPNTLAEAIACGLPCLSSNNGGTKELIESCNAGIVSQVDETYNYEMVDYYNPVKPNFSILENDFYKIFKNYNFYKNNIHFTNVSIDNASVKYIDFITRCWNENNR